MRAPLSLRLARSLLALAGGLAIGTAIFIAAASQDAVGASAWLLLLALDATCFFAAGILLSRDPRRAKLLAVGAALGMGALGVVTGFGAGMLSFPAAAIGALAAWAALLHPPKRWTLIAFALYLAVGIAVAVTTSDPSLSVFSLVFVLVWPGRFLLIPGLSFVGIYLLLGLAIGVVVLALVDRRTKGAGPSLRGRLMTIALALVVGAAALAAFYALALARPSSSARFELDPLVMGIAFVSGAVTALGLVGLRFYPSALSSIALGAGAATLFLVFTARPAVVCQSNGVAQGMPLAWQLRGASGWASQSSSGTSLGGGNGNVSSGESRLGDRVARSRCEGDRLVEYLEEAGP